MTDTKRDNEVGILRAVCADVSNSIADASDSS